MNGDKDVTTQISPRQVMEAVCQGRKRLHNFRMARLMFLRNYVGSYYDREQGRIGSEPLNLIFNAIRVLIPNIVLTFPRHSVHTPYLSAKNYADMMGLTLEQHDKQINITDTYRAVVVDAIFTLGIMKTGLASSDTVYAVDDDDRIDAGTVYTERVDFENFICDPGSKEHLFRDARFLGDTICVPRQKLLDSGLYNNDLIMKLPRAGGKREKEARELSMRGINSDAYYDMEDDVEISEIWVPSANAILTVPADEDFRADDYLAVSDYYGVKEGPYTLLALTPPVPSNPLPVPMVGIWNDLHLKANEMASKIIEQATSQKNIIAYKRAAADDVDEARRARDGAAVAMDDPDAAKVLSFGGQTQSNEVHLAQLQQWFNMMAGNPEQMGGQAVAGNSATANVILQQNAGTGLEDMKNLVYQAAASEARKRAWYFHTDPLMRIPLTKRQMAPAQFYPGPLGPIMVSPPQMSEVQVILTPEARSGEFIDFIFTIEPESMGRKDSRTRLAQGMDFCTKMIPAIATAAQTFAMMGLPFSPKAMLLRMAKDAGIDWLDEVFYDPEFQQQMMQQMAMGPQMGASKGQSAPTGPSAMAGPGAMDAIMQNGQPGQVQGGSTSDQTQLAQFAQQGANPGQTQVQSIRQGGGGY